ncbi:MAG TPA: nuclear transport factor 2 family protein [Longimicrobiales bacterium]
MKRLEGLCLALLLAAGPAAAQGGAAAPAASPAQDSAAVRQASLDYVEGYFTADVARMERALHSDLEKRIVNSSGGRNTLGQMSAQTLIEITASGGGAAAPADQRVKEYALLELDRDVAVTRVVSGRFVDFVQLARWNGQWKILNVLWEMAPGAVQNAERAAPPDTSAILATATDFIQGWFDSDEGRLRRAIHPELVKRAVHLRNGRSSLEHLTARRLLDATRAGYARQIPADRRTSQLAVLDTYGNVAMVRVRTPDEVEHLQLARWNGAWKVINVLFEERS